MTKLICIDDKWNSDPGSKNSPAPFVGEECEVIALVNFRRELYYQLGGRFEITSGFHHSMFAVQSDLDEKEILQNRIGELDHQYNY